MVSGSFHKFAVFLDKLSSAGTNSKVTENIFIIYMTYKDILIILICKANVYDFPMQRSYLKVI